MSSLFEDFLPLNNLRDFVICVADLLKPAKIWAAVPDAVAANPVFAV